MSENSDDGLRRDVIWQKYAIDGLFALMLLGLLLRIYKNGSQSFWLDEMVSIDIALADGLTGLTWDLHPPLYHVILKAWLYLFGTSEAAVRSLSAFVSVFGIACVFYLGVWSRSLLAGFLAALILMLHPTSISFGQEARMYSLMEALTACTWLFFFKIVVRNSSWVPWLFSALALSLTHFFSVFVLGYQCLFLMRKKSTRKPLFVITVVMAPFLALGAMWLAGPHSIQSLSWQQLRFQMVPRFEDLLQSTFSIFGSWFSLAGFSVGLLALGWQYKKATEPGQKLPYLFLFHFLVVFVSMAAIELMLQRSLFVSRYFIFATPLFAVAAAILIDFQWRSGSRWLALVIGSLIFGGSVSRLNATYEASRPPWREVSELIAQSQNPVVFTTRTLSLRSPYFSSKSISVMSWPSTNIQNIKQQIIKGQSVWFVENYWGQLTYWEQLKQVAREEGLILEEKVFSLIEKDPIYTLRLSSSE